MAILNFDISQYEAPKSNFDPLPRGDYQAIVTESQMKITKAGTGEYLELVMQIVDGEFSGRKIWERLNLINENAATRSMAMASLTSLCKALDNGADPYALDENLLIDVPVTMSLDIDRKDPTRDRKSVV